MAGWNFSRDLTRHLLIGGCGQSTYLLRMAEITFGAVMSLTTWQNRNWGTFKSCREWNWPWEENLDPKELNQCNYAPMLMQFHYQVCLKLFIMPAYALMLPQYSYALNSSSLWTYDSVQLKVQTTREPLITQADYEWCVLWL